jgi:hypothetical protein
VPDPLAEPLAGSRVEPERSLAGDGIRAQGAALL